MLLIECLSIKLNIQLNFSNWEIKSKYIVRNSCRKFIYAIKENLIYQIL